MSYICPCGRSSSCLCELRPVATDRDPSAAEVQEDVEHARLRAEALREPAIADVQRELAEAPECVCTDWCPEEFGDEHFCRHCGGLDIYEPCPRVGFGCGAGGNTNRCDCCSDAEWLAAGGSPAALDPAGAASGETGR